MIPLHGWVRETFCMKEIYLNFKRKGGIVRRTLLIMRVPNKPVHEQMETVVGFLFEIFKHVLHLRICI